MIHQSYTHALPFGMLLRRLIADEWALDDIPKEVARMEAYGDIEYRGRLRPPGRWWVVLISEQVSGHPNGKLSIETEDPDHPIDPFQILYVERLSPPSPPPPTPAKPRKLKGKHKTAAEKIADASEIIAAVDDYRKQHPGCYLEDAFEALHQEHGHASREAMKRAFYRACGVKNEK